VTTDLIPDAAGRVDRVSRRWGLARDAQLTYGEWNLVLLVRRGDEPCALRVCGPGTDVDDEVAALQTWGGNGAVRLLQVDREERVLLLERLDPDHSLRSLPLASAAAFAGQVIRRLSVPAPPGLPLLVDVAQDAAGDMTIRQQQLGNPVPTAILTRAVGLAHELAGDAGSTLVHGDLHYGNVLAGTRQPWLAIDPKPFTGHPERSIAELLWTRLDEVADASGIRALAATIVEAAQLDHERAYAWAVLRATSYWLWGLANGLTEDPVRCRRLLEALGTSRIL
jgi:streptomycin 6-kinase